MARLICKNCKTIIEYDADLDSHLNHTFGEDDKDSVYSDDSNEYMELECPECGMELECEPVTNNTYKV